MTKPRFFGTGALRLLAEKHENPSFTARLRRDLPVISQADDCVRSLRPGAALRRRPIHGIIRAFGNRPPRSAGIPQKAYRMMGYTHAAIGCVLALGVNHLFPSVLGRTPEILGMAVLGSLAPDLDEPQSLLGKKLAVIAHPLKLLLGHRGFTHSLAALGLVVVALFGLSSAGYGPRPSYGLAFVLGYAGHLLADWMTSSGAPLLWPNPARYASPLPMRTGGAAEHMVAVLVVAAGAWLVRAG